MPILNYLMIAITLLGGKRTRQNENPHGSNQNKNDLIKIGDNFLKSQ